MAFFPFEAFKAFMGKAFRNWTGQTAIEEQNKANLKLAQYQTQVQEQMYNKYSSPSAMMRQYQEAGLNPNLVYGSLASGQSNVPSFNAPTVERSMSGSQKFEKSLSTASQFLGLMQGVYQTAAAREAAQQSAIRTANDIVNYRNNYRQSIFNEDLMGLKVSLPKFGIFTKGQSLTTPWRKSDVYNTYLGAYRESEFNKWAESVFRNYYDYGTMYDLNGQLRTADYMKNGIQPYYYIRNQHNQLRYNLMNELGNNGVYGKLAISLLNTFF